MWKERNERVFNGASIVVEHSVCLYVAKWVSSRVGFDNLRVDGVFHNWEATLYSGAKKVRSSMSWVPPSQGVFEVQCGCRG